MANRTTFIVADDLGKLLLEKVAGMEVALEAMLPLLEKIVAHQEAQAAKPTVPIATYGAMYPMEDAGPPEGELVAALQPAPAPPVGWWGRRFPRRASAAPHVLLTPPTVSRKPAKGIRSPDELL